jgi:hypothetical protein
MGMNMNFIKTSLILIGLLLLATPSTVVACSCAWSTPATAFNDSEAVFIGKMLVGTEKLQETDGTGKQITIEAGNVRFAVEKAFKGDVKGEITIEIASMAGTSCGPYGLVRNESYVVYAYRNKKDRTVLYTGVCTRTISVESKDAKEDLDFLRTLPPPGTGGKLEGRIWYDSKVMWGGAAVAMPNLKVIIRDSNNKEFVVTTDKNGKFEIEKLKVGTYQVEPQIPENFYVKKNFQTVEVADRGTATVGFEAYYTGNVSGRVVDKNGDTYNSIFLHLLSTDGEEKNIYGHSIGENGEFEFEGVPPGNYLMFLELQHDDYEKDRNYYYPGTYDQATATVIKVGLGGKVEGIKFTLPREYEVRTIEGQVIWENGKPAAKAEVTLRCPTGLASNRLAIEFGAKSTETDDNGKFRLEVFAGETYWLDASILKPAGKDTFREYYSKSKRILVKENVRNEKLVILKKNGASETCR